jgi:hypothetical protein
MQTAPGQFCDSEIQAEPVQLPVREPCAPAASQRPAVEHQPQLLNSLQVPHDVDAAQGSVMQSVQAL